MHKADKIGALLREAFDAGAEYIHEGTTYNFEAWLADNGDEILAAVAELAQGVRAQEAAKVRGLTGPAYWPWRARHGSEALEMGRAHLINALARDIEDGTL